MLESIPNELKELLIALSLTPGKGRLATRDALQAWRVRGKGALHALRNHVAHGFRNQGREILALSTLRGIGVVTLGEPSYPERLANIPDAPPLLFVRGDMERLSAALSETFSVAIVGSRRATGYGTRIARRMAEEVTEAGGIVVSGLAKGIDTAAHEGALVAAERLGSSAGIAVLGSGLLRVYPAQNRELCDALCDEGGCIVSEYPPLDPPTPYNFPERNRIVSGLSDAVVLIEAGEKSGALITARLAAEQGRDVLVVPGAVDSSASLGSNELLVQGAAPCRGLRDILDGNTRLRALVREPGDFSGAVTVTAVPNRRVALKGLSAEDQWYVSQILKLIDRHGTLDFEALLAQLTTDAPRLRATLIELELAGLVFSLGGSGFATSESIDR